MKKGKILIVSSSSMMKSGISWSLLGMAKYLQSNDYDFSILLPRKGELEEHLIEMNIPHKIIRNYKIGWCEKPRKNGIITNLKTGVKEIINQIALYSIKSYIKKRKI